MCGGASHYPGLTESTIGRKALVKGRDHTLLGIGSASTLSSARVVNKASAEGVVDSREILTGAIAAALPTTTPSPLTVSARDIEAGSMDFTELATGMNVSSASSSQSCVQQQDWRTDLLHTQNENLGTPRGTSSPAAPIKVRVSARRLKEIPSPYLSRDGSSCPSTPRALTPPDSGVDSKEAASTGKLIQCEWVGNVPDIQHWQWEVISCSNTYVNCGPLCVSDITFLYHVCVCVCVCVLCNAEQAQENILWFSAT